MSQEEPFQGVHVSGTLAARLQASTTLSLGPDAQSKGRSSHDDRDYTFHGPAPDVPKAPL